MIHRCIIKDTDTHTSHPTDASLYENIIHIQNKNRIAHRHKHATNIHTHTTRTHVHTHAHTHKLSCTRCASVHTYVCVHLENSRNRTRWGRSVKNSRKRTQWGRRDVGVTDKQEYYNRHTHICKRKCAHVKANQTAPEASWRWDFDPINTL